jgi:hypothetical protein
MKYKVKDSNDSEYVVIHKDLGLSTWDGCRHNKLSFIQKLILLFL